MKNYINENGNLTDYIGREIKDGDTIKVHLGGTNMLFSVYYDENEGKLTAKHGKTEAFVETLCECANKLEIVNNNNPK